MANGRVAHTRLPPHMAPDDPVFEQALAAVDERRQRSRPFPRLALR